MLQIICGLLRGAKLCASWSHQNKSCVCHGRINPTGEMFFDGVTLGPYDVLYVKMKSLMLEGKTSGTTKALQYQGWMDSVVSIWLP